MYNTIKKLSLTFILLNVFTFQSLMADMIFYYNAAILPSIIASKQQTLAPEAVHDEVTPDNIAQINLDVLANDNIAPASNVTVLLEMFGLEGPEYVNRVQTMDGNWTVEANQSVTFTPNADFSGGEVWIQYQIKDQDDHTSKNDIAIKYPLFVYAEQDQVQKDIIELVAVNVLDNDTINGTLETLLLESYDPQTGEIAYVSNVYGYGGTWTVDGPTVMFIPEDNFGGGTVGIWYQITDDQGHVSQTWISIEFPLYVQANHDQVQANSGGAVTVNVLENDNIDPDVTPTILLETYGENGPEYVSSIETMDGNWTVEVNQSVTFIPSANFAGRYVHMEYQLSDGNGHMSNTGIDLEYPVEIYAEYDHEQKTEIEEVNIDVVANDTHSSPVMVLFEVNQGTGGTEYLDSVESFDGNWTVENNQSVTFTPNANFGGGQVWMWYQITDQEGRTSTNGIGIEYPVYVYAEWDQVTKEQIEFATVNVLNNDTNTSAVSILLVNRNGNTGSEDIVENIVTNQGEWNVAGDTVTFDPNPEFTGGSVYIDYQITDSTGRMSRNIIEIVYPIAASSVCPIAPQTELVSLAEIVTAVSDNVGFKDDNGRRGFETRLDTDMYVIPDDLFGNLAAIGNPLNPMYFIEYEDENQTSYVRAELGIGQITLFDNNMTWSYEEERVQNDNGTKTIEAGGDGGDYSIDANDTNNLTIGGQSVFTFKAVHTISNSDMINMLEPNIVLTPNTDNTAQLIVTKTMETRYWWNDQSWYSDTFSDLEDFITAKSYDSNIENLFEGVLHTRSGGKTIIFAASSTGTSGDLVEVAYSGNILLTENAGTWSIETITDEDGTYDVLSLKPILCGYEETLYKLDMTGNIIQGGFDEVAGDIGAEIMFSEGLKDELKTFFIDDAILDVDPSTGP